MMSFNNLFLSLTNTKHCLCYYLNTYLLNTWNGIEKRLGLGPWWGDMNGGLTKLGS